MHETIHPSNSTLSKYILVLLACVILFHLHALAQTSPTTEYIRAGDGIIAVLHQPPSVFSDLSGQQYAAEADLLGAEQISSGTSCGGTPPTFCPNLTLTRDQLAVLPIISSIYVALQG